MSDTRVSVVIPAYNYAAYLPYAIDSVLQQEGIETDVVVVDDGSTDNTADVVSRYDSRVAYYYQDNAGPAAARAHGMSHAEGDCVVFLDADDLLTPGLLASQVHALQNNPDAGLVVCFNQLVSSAGPGMPLASVGTWPLFKNNFAVHLCHFNIMPVHAVMTRKEILTRIGTFDATLWACEDHDYWLRCAAAGYLPVLNPEGLVLYRKHGTSLSDNSLHEHIHNVILHKRVHALLLSHPHFPTGLRPDAWIAHAAGCLVTAVRLYKHNKDVSDTLLGLCGEAIKHAAKAIALHRKQWQRTPDSDNVLGFYALQAFDHLDALIQAGEASLVPARDILKKLLPESNINPPLRQQMRLQMVPKVYCRQPYITNFSSGARAFEKVPHEALHLGTRGNASLPRISVVMATFNAETFLERALNSVETQRYPYWEVIVQDGASTDGTLEILERHRNTIRFATAPDQGVYDAWNKALPHITGDWAIFLGADDLLLNKTTLARCAEHLSKLPSHVVYAYGVLLQGSEGKITYVFNRSLHEVYTTFASDMGLPFPATFIRTDFLKHQTFNTEYTIAADFELAARTITHKNVARIPVCISFMEAGGLSTRTEFQTTLLRERKKVLRECVFPRHQELFDAIIGSIEMTDRTFIQE